jgi:hypothetical protein
MTRTTSIFMTLAVSGLAFAAYQPAAFPCGPTPPAQCAAGRELNGYNMGYLQGQSTVLQIWRSPAVDQNPDNWDKLDKAVRDTIKPMIATTLARTNIDQYLRCRVQGMLDGTLCKMNDLNPIPGCMWDGAVWGDFSAYIYCAVSVALDGLADVTPWFVRLPTGMCGTGFQNYCDSVYRYGANHTVYSLPTTVDPVTNMTMEQLLVSNGYNPISSLWQPAVCEPYTVDDPVTGKNFQTIFESSVALDCAYLAP